MVQPLPKRPRGGTPFGGTDRRPNPLFLDGFLLHFTPEVTFTVGLVDSSVSSPECGGTGEIVETDLRGFDQV